MQLSISNIGLQNGEEEAVYALLQKYGFTGLEIAPSRFVGDAPYLKKEEAAAEAARLKARYGLRIPSMQSIWYGQTGNIFEVHEAQQLIDYTAAAVRFAAAVGCPSLVFGCPRNRSLPQGKTAQDAVPFFTQLALNAYIHGTAIALEANPPLYNTNFINTTAEAFAFARSIPHMRVNYDAGTCIINEESLDVLADNLPLVSHIHISEPQLALIAPRELHTQLAALLREKAYPHFVSIEMKSQPLAEVERTLSYIAEVFA